MRFVSIFLILYYIFFIQLIFEDWAYFVIFAIAIPIFAIGMASASEGRTPKEYNKYSVEREKRMALNKKNSDKSYNIKIGNIVLIGLWLGFAYLFNEVSTCIWFIDLSSIQLIILYVIILLIILIDTILYQWDY